MISIEMTYDQAEEVIRQELASCLVAGGLEPDVEKAMRVVLAWYSVPQSEE
jgi:hypothetical protein